MATDINAPLTAPGRSRSFFGQPFALANLFGVEMWERFSFYGMQGILLFYLYYSAAEGGLGYDKDSATSIVGAYGGLVYLSTILGGWVADRLLGSERTLFYSAIMIMFGHLSLAILPGITGVAVGLSLIGVGSGGVKANATSIVGELYEPGDPRRDAGFSIFYMGINLGALVGPLLTGLLQSKIGFHVGFAAAAIGMALGLIQYAIGRKSLGSAGADPSHPLLPAERMRFIWAAVGVLVVIGAVIGSGLVTAANLSDVVIGITAAAAVAYFAVILSSKQITAVERSRVVAFIPMFLASAVFWSLYQQQFTTIPVFADTRLDRHIFGWEFPPSWVLSINPIMIVTFAGVFAAMWTKLGDRQPRTPIKFAGGTIIMGLAFLAFIPFTDPGPGSTPLVSLVFIILLFTFAELLLSPVGLSLATKLAPQAFRTQMVALFFLSVALGTAASGTLAGFYNPKNDDPFFLWTGLASIVVGVCLAGVSPWVSKKMAGVR
ncbi:MAG: peptide MFS transporter [Nocardiaceae bacterium]|nr:peptide MFS transporter [Nocardiaceae bacterium]